MRKIVLILCISFTALLADIVEVKAIGYGNNQESAISNALASGIEKVSGVAMDSSRSTGYRGWYDHAYTEKNIRSYSQGLIETYEIQEVIKEDGRKYKATLLVKVNKFKAKGLDHSKRVKIAIMPFYISQKYYNISGHSVSGYKTSMDIREELTTYMTQSNKFSVLDREYANNVNQELNLIGSGDGALKEKMKLGQKLGADFIIVGTIKDIESEGGEVQHSIVESSVSDTTVKIRIDYRIIVPSTTQIKWSDSAELEFTAEDDIEKSVEEKIQSIAKNIGNSILEYIYPIRVAKITKNDQVLLTQGGSSIQEGAQFDVMHLGEEIMDEYTGESLGQEEENIATIEITKVTPKISYAKVIKGSIASIAKSDICRRINE